MVMNELDQIALEVFGTPESGNYSAGGAPGVKSLMLSDKVKAWSPIVERESLQYGVDPDFVLGVMQQESRGNPEAESNVGAYGLMQLMPETAKELGVNQYDPEQNISGGVKLLSDLLKKYNGDKKKALAAYNGGESGVNQAVSKYGDSWLEHLHEFKGINKNTGKNYAEETRDYIEKISGYVGLDSGPADFDKLAAAIYGIPYSEQKQQVKTEIPELANQEINFDRMNGTDLSIPEPTKFDPNSAKFQTESSDATAIQTDPLIGEMYHNLATLEGPYKAALMTGLNALTFTESPVDPYRFQEHPIASTVGAVAGSIVPAFAGGAGVQKALLSIPKVAKLAQAGKWGTWAFQGVTRAATSAADFVTRNNEELLSSDPKVREKAVKNLGISIAASLVSPGPEVVLPKGWIQPLAQMATDAIVNTGLQAAVGENAWSKDNIIQTVASIITSGLFSFNDIRKPTGSNPSINTESEVKPNVQQEMQGRQEGQVKTDLSNEETTSAVLPEGVIVQGEPVGRSIGQVNAEAEVRNQYTDNINKQQEELLQQLSQELNPKAPNRDQRRFALESGMRENPVVVQMREKYGETIPTKAQVVKDFGVNRETAGQMIKQVFGEVLNSSIVKQEERIVTNGKQQPIPIESGFTGNELSSIKDTGREGEQNSQNPPFEVPQRKIESERDESEADWIKYTQENINESYPSEFDQWFMGMPKEEQDKILYELWAEQNSDIYNEVKQESIDFGKDVNLDNSEVLQQKANGLMRKVRKELNSLSVSAKDKKAIEDYVLGRSSNLPPKESFDLYKNKAQKNIVDNLEMARLEGDNTGKDYLNSQGEWSIDGLHSLIQEHHKSSSLYGKKTGPKQKKNETPADKIKSMTPEMNPLTMGGIAAAPSKTDGETGTQFPKYAINVNLERINAGDDVKKVILETSADYEGKIQEARRGTITHETTRELADKLGLTEEQLLKRRKGQAFNAEEALAARDILNSSANRIVSLTNEVMKKRADGTVTDKDLVDFRLEVQKHAAIQAEVSGLTAEAGRALSAFRIMSENNKNIKNAQDILDSFGGKEKVETILDNVKKLNDDQLSKVDWTKVLKEKVVDKIHRYFIESILSGPPTHLANIISNAATAMYRVGIEKPSTVATEAVLSKVQKRKANRYIGEVPAEFTGMIKAIPEAINSAKNTLFTGIQKAGVKTEDSQILTTETQFTPLKQNKYGALLPTRWLSAADEFFKVLNYSGEISSLAYRQAKTEGHTGENLSKRYIELLSNPEEKMSNDAWEEARYRTFTDSPGRITRQIMSLRRSIPGARYVIPFLNTPVKILKYGLERTPVSSELMLYKKIKSGEISKENLSDEIGKMLFSHIAAIPIVMAAMNGSITGSGPQDTKKRNELLRTGWLPYSIKIGDTYVSYSRIEPIATVIGAIADFSTLDIGDDLSLTDIAGRIGYAIQQNITNKTFFSQLANFVKATEDFKQYGENFITNFASSAIPNLSGKIADAVDPYYRNANTLTDIYLRKIPGVSEILYPRRDIFGRPIEKSPSGLMALFSPVKVSNNKENFVDKEIARLELGKGMPSKNTLGIKLSDAQYDDYSKVSGELAYKRVKAFMESEAYKKLDDEKRRKIISAKIDKSREFARSELIKNYNIEPVENLLIEHIKSNPSDSFNKVYNDLKKQGYNVNRSKLFKMYKEKVGQK